MRHTLSKLAGKCVRLPGLLLHQRQQQLCLMTPKVMVHSLN